MTYLKRSVENRIDSLLMIIWLPVRSRFDKHNANKF